MSAVTVTLKARGSVVLRWWEVTDGKPSPEQAAAETEITFEIPVVRGADDSPAARNAEIRERAAFLARAYLAVAAGLTAASQGIDAARPRIEDLPDGGEMMILAFREMIDSGILR